MDNSGAPGLVLCNSGASVEKMTRWKTSVPLTLAVRGNTILSCMTQYNFEFYSQKPPNFKVVLK